MLTKAVRLWEKESRAGWQFGRMRKCDSKLLKMASLFKLHQYQSSPLPRQACPVLRSPLSVPEQKNHIQPERVWENNSYITVGLALAAILTKQILVAHLKQYITGKAVKSGDSLTSTSTFSSSSSSSTSLPSLSSSASFSHLMKGDALAWISLASSLETYFLDTWKRQSWATRLREPSKQTIKRHLFYKTLRIKLSGDIQMYWCASNVHI